MENTIDNYGPRKRIEEMNASELREFAADMRAKTEHLNEEVRTLQEQVQANEDAMKKSSLWAFRVYRKNPHER